MNAVTRLERTQSLARAALKTEVLPPNYSLEEIFALLLRKGRVEEALCLFRAHNPFGEFDSEAIPMLLSRHLPIARKNRVISLPSFISLLSFLEEDITHKLSPESSKLLAELAETQTTEILLRILPDEYLSVSNDHAFSGRRADMEQTLLLSIQIARCGNLAMLQELVEETLELYTKYQLLRPARILYCIDDSTKTRQSVLRRREMDVEAILWRIVDAKLAGDQALLRELVANAQTWCANQASWAACVSNFLAAHPSLLSEHALVVLDLVALLEEDAQKKRAAVLLCISRFTPPFPQQLWDILQPSSSSSVQGNWDKELKQMRVREIAAKYHEGSAFDLSKHLKQMQQHLCTLCAGATDLPSFDAVLLDLLAISAQYEQPRLALLILQFASHNLALEEEFDRMQRVKLLFSKLALGGEEKLSICQEAIQYMLLCCADEEEEEVDRVLTANWGITLCQLCARDFTTTSATSAAASAAALYLDLGTCEDTFRDTKNALLLVDEDQSAMFSEEGDATAFKPSTAETSATTAMDAQIASLLEASVLTSEELDDMNDAILLREVRQCCEESHVKQNVPAGRFRDCPNVLDTGVLVAAIELGLGMKRHGALLLGNNVNGNIIPRYKKSANKAPELDSYSATFFREGAYQLALRFKAHVALHFPSPKSAPASIATEEVKIEYMLTTLVRNALEEACMDEALILGYLLSLNKRDAVVNTLNAQIKRFRYDNNAGEFARFERLCWMGKLMANTWQDVVLEKHFGGKEAVFYWFKRLSGAGIAFNALKMYEFDAKEIQSVANSLFAQLFDAVDYDERAYAQYIGFLQAFDVAASAQVLAHSVIALLLQWHEQKREDMAPSTSAVLWKWCAPPRCDFALLLPALDKMSLDATDMARVRLALDILVEATTTAIPPGTEFASPSIYVSRLLLVELFEANFAAFLRDPVRECVQLKQSFQSYTEAELVDLVATGLALDKRSFVSDYARHQLVAVATPAAGATPSNQFDAFALIQVMDTLVPSTRSKDAEFKLELALELLDMCPRELCKEQLELARFAHTMFPARAELQLRVEALERRCIFHEFGLDHMDKNLDALAPEQLLRVFYEECAAKPLRRGMFHAALTIMRGNVAEWTKTLKRCLVDWLQASTLTFDVVSVIVRALQHLEREAGVDAEQFLTGIAFMSSNRIKKVAIVRALRALQRFRQLSFKEEDLLWMKERELEMKDCAIWKQTIEQVVQTANKPSSVRGLLREISQTCLNPEREIKGLRFIAQLIIDFSLYDGEAEGLLEACLSQLVQVDAQACLKVLLEIPANSLGAVRDLAIWLALRDNTAPSAFIVLLERCPFDDFVTASCQHLLRLANSNSSGGAVAELRTKALQRRYA